jgi:hypothetical protein
MTQETKEARSVKNLITALAKARSAMAAPKKSASNPAFRSKFADLASILEAIEPALAANDLIVTQTLRPTPVGQELVTTLWHTSGESLESVATLHPEKQTLQGLGSAITYLRRYSLQALLCLAAEDDDGNSASGVKPTTQRPAPLPSPPPMGTTAPSAASVQILARIAAAQSMAELTEAVSLMADGTREVVQSMPEEDKAKIRASFKKRKEDLA